MIPFSTPHMALLRPLPTSLRSRRRALDRWLSVALPPVRAQVRRSAGRRQVRDPHELDELTADTVARIYERALEGAYEARHPTRDDATVVLGHVDNFIRARTRAARREARRLHRLGEDSDQVVAELADTVERWTEAALERQEATLIRSLPASACQRLVILLHVHPDQVTRADVAAAVSESRTVTRDGQPRRQGLSRDLGDTWGRLQRWIPRGVRMAEQAALVRQHGLLRLWLAWILRGPDDGTSFEHWSVDDARRGINWLDQQRSRGRRALRTVLEAEEGGREPLLPGAS